MSSHTDLLIIGAGPFGLTSATYAERSNMDYLIVGRPMSFWKDHMPTGMYLRSGSEWHLDPDGIFTIEKYIESKGLSSQEVHPLSLNFYLGYAKWFEEQFNFNIQETYVERLDQSQESQHPYKATLENGEIISANAVIVAIGFEYFKNIPPELSAILPDKCFSHSCDMVDFTELKGKNVLIIGGRQSAYEWAALVGEAGANTIHIVHRHDSPEFVDSDWQWVDPIVDTMHEEPEWFHNLTVEEREEINGKFWSEGRLKLEPWLWERIDKDHINIWENSNVAFCEEVSSGKFQVRLDTGENLRVHHIILATGYKVDIAKVPFLGKGNLISNLKVDDGYPLLGESLQTNLKNLYMTSMIATKQFGLFFAFTAAARASAKIIGSGLKNSL
jgi:thioredoxin reductase